VSTKDDRLYLVHISERITRIEEYTQDGRAAFFASPMQQDAVVRNFEIVGEAAKRISDELKQRHPQIPWQRIAGFRDVLIHQYMGVDLNEVWRIVEQDVPTLRTQIAALLTQPEAGTDDTDA
jgi:uncharacterized protein with HEPN domain